MHLMNAHDLTYRVQTTAVTESGAPSGEKQVVMWQPPVECSSEGEDTMRSPFVESAEIVADLMGAGLQTLAFVPARKASPQPEASQRVFVFGTCIGTLL